MKMDFRAIAIFSFLLLTCQSVLAATASGSSAFALASLVAKMPKRLRQRM